MNAFDPVIGALDAALERPALVFGTPPPAGRDLDLLVREPEEQTVAAVLEREGFRRHGSVWARFGGRSALAVELVPAAELRLPPPQVDALYAEAAPLNGHARLLRPSARHVHMIRSRLAKRRRVLSRLRPAMMRC